MDIKQEEILEEQWLDGNTLQRLTMSTLSEIIYLGIDECEEKEYCASRNTAKHGYCRCIRNLLPCPETHKLYEMLQLLELQLEIAKQLKIDCDTPAQQEITHKENNYQDCEGT
jgi:hypothetical protein